MGSIRAKVPTFRLCVPNQRIKNRFFRLLRIRILIYPGHHYLHPTHNILPLDLTFFIMTLTSPPLRVVNFASRPVQGVSKVRETFTKQVNQCFNRFNRFKAGLRQVYGRFNAYLRQVSRGRGEGGCNTTPVVLPQNFRFVQAELLTQEVELIYRVRFFHLPPKYEF